MGLGTLGLCCGAAGGTLLWLNARRYNRTGEAVEGSGMAAGMLLGAAFWLLLAWVYFEAGPALRD